MKLSHGRFDPSELTPEDFREVERMLAGLASKRCALVGANDERFEFPEPVYNILRHALKLLSERKKIILLPEDEACTTQAAAEFLGMSRPFLISLLEGGKIPFHLLGRHRRVYLRDLAEYQQSMVVSRRSAMNDLTSAVLAAEVDDNACEE